jgi:hypothetical protein
MSFLLILPFQSIVACCSSINVAIAVAVAAAMVVATATAVAIATVLQLLSLLPPNVTIANVS